MKTRKRRAKRPERRGRRCVVAGKKRSGNDVATRASTVTAVISCDVSRCVCPGWRHCRNECDQNRERTKVAEGCFLFLFLFLVAQVEKGEGDWRDFVFRPEAAAGRRLFIGSKGMLCHRAASDP